MKAACSTSPSYHWQPAYASVFGHTIEIDWVWHAKAVPNQGMPLPFSMMERFVCTTQPRDTACLSHVKNADTNSAPLAGLLFANFFQNGHLAKPQGHHRSPTDISEDPASRSYLFLGSWKPRSIQIIQLMDVPWIFGLCRLSPRHQSPPI